MNKWISILVLILSALSTLAANVHEFVEFTNIPGYKVAFHYQTGGNKNLALTSHGYGDHCVYMAPIHQQLLSNGYDIICVDMPGHGQSSGNRYDIDHFETYSTVARELLSKAERSHYDQVIFVGFSTGNVGMTQLLLNHHEVKLDHIVMISPLIRSYLWGPSKFLLENFPWVTILPMRRDLGYESYRSIFRTDIYKQDFVPTHWAKELIRWNEKINQMPDQRVLTPINFIFGGNDTVLDSEFTLKTYRRHFLNGQFHFLPKAGHQMFFESKENQRDFANLFQQILTTFD